MRLTLLSFTLAWTMASCGGDARPAAAGEDGTPPAALPTSTGCGGTASAGGAAGAEPCVRSVRGTVLDPSGKTLSAPVSLCGQGLCFATLAEDGSYAINVERRLDLTHFLVHVAGHPSHTDLFHSLATSARGEVVSLPPLSVPAFDDIGDGVPDDAGAGATLTAGPLSLVLTPGTKAVIYPAHQSSEGRRLRTGTVPDRERWGESLVALIATGPFGARFESRVTVSIELPASAALADGVSLDVLVLEDDLTHPDVGKLVPSGRARVSGGIATSEGGDGIDRLTWIALRRR